MRQTADEESNFSEYLEPPVRAKGVASPVPPYLNRFLMRSLSRLVTNPLLHVVGARAISFPITIISGFVWLRLVIGQLGSDEYAFVALIVGLQFLLGFLDFGTGAHVLESAGQYRAHKDVDALGRALGAAWYTILLGNLLLLVAAIGLFIAGAWGPILGFPDHSSAAGLAVVLILAINVLVRPLSLSTALVAGLGRPAIATWCQALSGLSSLALLAIVLTLKLPVAFVSATPIAGQLVAFSVPFFLLLKTIPGVMKATVRGMRRRSRAGQELRRLAVPMLLIQAIGPLNDQLDRLILSHLSTVEVLAIYSLGAQLLSGAQSFITALTPALWAEFAELRAKGGPHAAVARSLGYIKRLWIVGLLFGAVFCVLGHTLAPLISAGQLQLSWVFCAVLGASLPLSMVVLLLGIGLTDPRSLRVQPVLLSVTTAINIALTVALAAQLGELGPALASVIATLIFIPLLSILAWKRLRDGARADETRPATSAGDSLASHSNT